MFYHNLKGTGNRLTFVAGVLSFCAYLSYQGKITYALAEDNLSYCDKIRKHPKKDDGTFQPKRRDVFEKRLREIEFCVEIKEFINKPLEL